MAALRLRPYLAWDIGRPQPAFDRLTKAGDLVGSVLDAGCGTGEHAFLAASLGREVAGVDLSAKAIALAMTKATERATRRDSCWQTPFASLIWGSFRPLVQGVRPQHSPRLQRLEGGSEPSAQFAQDVQIIVRPLNEPRCRKIPEAVIEDTRRHAVAQGLKGSGSGRPSPELPEDAERPPSP